MDSLLVAAGFRTGALGAWDLRDAFPPNPQKNKSFNAKTQRREAAERKKGYTFRYVFEALL